MISRTRIRSICSFSRLVKCSADQWPLGRCRHAEHHADGVRTERSTASKRWCTTGPTFLLIRGIREAEEQQQQVFFYDKSYELVELSSKKELAEHKGSFFKKDAGGQVYKHTYIYIHSYTYIYIHTYTYIYTYIGSNWSKGADCVYQEHLFYTRRRRVQTEMGSNEGLRLGGPWRDRDRGPFDRPDSIALLDRSIDRSMGAMRRVD
jgi:hypothetical protein